MSGVQGRLKRIGRSLLGRTGGVDTSVPEQAAPAAASLNDNPYVAQDLDLEALARTSKTRLERLYYSHAGSPMFKWRQYLPLYDEVLAPFVGKNPTIVEVGLATGASIQLWKAYFGGECRIVGVDIDPAALAFAEPGVEIMIGDQGDPAFLKSVADQVGAADIVIDDGSHICAHQIATIDALFPIVKDGGVYVCEDLHTSYWAPFGGGVGREDTFIGWSKTLIDRIHAHYYTDAPAKTEIAAQIGKVVIADSIMIFHKGAPEDIRMAVVGG